MNECGPFKAAFDKVQAEAFCPGLRGHGCLVVGVEPMHF